MNQYHSKNKNIRLYNSEEFEKMQNACRLTSRILDQLAYYVKPGVSTEFLDKLCHDLIIKNGAKAACLGYPGPVTPYTKTICTSINNVVCHGIPNEKDILKEGDIVNIDVTCILDGWYGDSSRMYYVGKKIPSFAQKLCEKTYESLMLAIEQAKPGKTLGDIGHVIQNCVESVGYSVVEGYCGHGVGQKFHMEPHVFHHGNAGKGLVLEPGMIFTIEPMINLGKKETVSLKDGWTVVTKDSKLSAQFEHTVGITENGCVIFTKSEIGFDKPFYDLSKLTVTDKLI
jgi:methionyl aminopeptidase